MINNEKRINAYIAIDLFTSCSIVMPKTSYDSSTLMGIIFS